MIFINYLKEIFITIGVFLAVYLFRRNKTLITENQELKVNKLQLDKVINIQTKVLDASEKVKHTDLDVNLERLSDKTK